MTAPEGRLALVELAHLSDTGRVRHHNEDRALATPPMLAVADGMGGAQAGEVAAQVAVEAVGGLTAPADAEAVREAIAEANRSIRRMAEDDPEKAGMGTTLTAATVDGGRLDVFQVGDSRAYLWRDGRLRQLTEDHSVVAELVRRGSISPEDAESHPHRNVITRALGAEPEVRADTVSETLREDDVVLLCSDGLSSHVPAEEIAGALAEAPGLDEAARALVERANAAGGADNVTVVLARVGRADAGGAAPLAAHEPAEGDTRSAPTAEMRVLRGHAGHGEASGPSRAPRVLEPVPRRRRSRVRPALVAAIVLLAAVAGGVTWVGSRSYSLETSAEGTVRVAHGLPYSPAGLDFTEPWQDLGVPADIVRAEDPGSLSNAARGQGEAVELAARVVWRHGLPEVPRLAAPPPPAGAAGGGADGGQGPDGEPDAGGAQP